MATTISKHVRGFLVRNIPNRLIVVLAMSHERASDRVRILQLLTTHRFVIGVSNIKKPSSIQAYKELAPFVENGRYIYVNMNFKHFRVTRSSPNDLFIALAHKKHVPERCLCLDYFFLQHPYYSENYGTNWLLDKEGVRQTVVEGKCRHLLKYVTDIYLPIDKTGEMMAMINAYRDFPAKSMTTTMTKTSPLYASDVHLDDIPDRPAAPIQVTTYLNVAHPFLHVRLQ